jgi:Cfr10I/Bse634I restriction endonuclease
MNLVKLLPTGKYQIIANQAFCWLLDGKMPDANKLINGTSLSGALLPEFDKKIRLVATVDNGALSNVHGDWYEWLIAISAWNFCCANPNAHIPLLLPNVRQFDVSKLYKPSLYNHISDLRDKVKKLGKVSLISSNPDFVIIKRTIFDAIFGEIDPVVIITPEAIHDLETRCKKLTNQCDFDDIVGYVSIKTSLRPDRRLQLSHEGSLMKALYVHLQTREWITDPKGIKYYGITTKATSADKAGLNTVATHSLTTVFSIPQPAVDDLFEINMLSQAAPVFEKILL